MKRYASLLATGLTAMLLSLPTIAQTVAGVSDCSKARDPARCEARKLAHEQCKEKHGSDKRKCIHEKMPPPDCSKAIDQSRCEAHLKAQAACRGKSGKEMRACLKEQAGSNAFPQGKAVKK